MKLLKLKDSAKKFISFFSKKTKDNNTKIKQKIIVGIRKLSVKIISFSLKNYL